MLYTEKELQDTLKKDVTISKETEKRMQETYAQIRRDAKTSKKWGRKHSSMAAAAALAVILISAQPQELRISVHIPICLAMCSDSRAVRQKKLMIRS